ncbi:MAG: hypothetical protein ACMUHB_06760 [Thermoplasmatota archaeon]
MREGVIIIFGILVLSGTFLLLPDDGLALEDGVSFMTMFARDDLSLTPKHVNDTTMDFNRTGRWSQLPMVPWQWYRLGEWDSGMIETDFVNADPIEIMGETTIWITLSCPEQITMDLSGAFCVNSNPAVDSVILEDVEVGPEPVKFTIAFDTDGYTHENFAHFSMRWNMRNGHDDIVIHLGEEEAGTSTYIEPLFVQEIWDLGELGLSVEFINLFQEFEWTSYLEENETGWVFDFKASLDDGPWEEVEEFYRMQGATNYHYITVPGFDASPGEHVLRWEADYGVNSHSSGVYRFMIEEEEPGPPPDDDQPPQDDDEKPLDDNDDEPPKETLTEGQCRRMYTDAVGDDLHFWVDGNDFGVEKENIRKWIL